MNAMQQLQSVPEVDEDGFLLDPERWNANLASTLASQFGIESLTDEHWLVINALRDYFNKFGVAPAMNHISNQYGKDKNWVHSLFGDCLHAWCVVGLPNPGEEAKSYLSDM
ncbi:MAG: TusE/DsrC/DsvC family sulfur relay protein [Thioalkalispiraceae bacterium]|jgi:tRNA 2-thiouridine synthesizing protein E